MRKTCSGMENNMNFLESALILVPSLTGMELTVYEEDPEVLKEFERRYCFSTEIQKILTAGGLLEFFEKGKEKVVYDVVEPFQSHLILFKAAEKWILLGPYVEEGWNESAARRLLIRLRASEADISSYKSYRCRFPVSQQNYSVKIALLIAEHIDECGIVRGVRRLYMDMECEKADLPFPECGEDIRMINRRYHVEEKFITAVSLGETEKARECMEEFREVCAGLRFLSDELKDQITGAAIMRTLVRMGARKAGLSPVVIDSLSQEYAQKMQRTTFAAGLKDLTEELVESVCREVQEKQKNHYSSGVRKAIDYMCIHLAKPITVKELAKEAGINQQHLVKVFCQETGMTFKQYLAKKRCEIAAELLLESRLSVQEISAYVGYEDSNYFSKVFKINKGVSPQNYRKEQWSLL